LVFRPFESAYSFGGTAQLTQNLQRFSLDAFHPGILPVSILFIPVNRIIDSVSGFITVIVGSEINVMGGTSSPWIQLIPLESKIYIIIDYCDE
jgi:hypothetical protein